MTRSTVRLAVLAMLCSATLLAQRPVAGTATDPILGTWVLNLAESTYSPGPPPEPGTVMLRNYRLRPDGFMVTTFVTLSPDGEPSFLQVAWKYDNVGHPVYAATALTDLSTAGASSGSMAYRSIDPYTTDMTPRDTDGNVTLKGIRRRAVSSDGARLVDTTRGTNARGQRIDNVLIFDRCQAPCFQFSAP